MNKYFAAASDLLAFNNAKLASVIALGMSLINVQYGKHTPEIFLRSGLLLGEFGLGLGTGLGFRRWA